MIAPLIAAALGAALWSLAEYLLHRFAGHWPRGKIDFSREHLSHHAKPLYFTPTAKKVTIAAIATAVLMPLAALALGWIVGAAAVAGFISAYAAYEVVHRQCHVRGPRNAYGRLVRRHHFHHHFGAPKMNHGVTSPLWDLVFGTYARPERVKVPARHAMSWLLDDDGDVALAHQADYVIRRRGAAKSDRRGGAVVQFTDRETAFANRAPE